MDTVKLRFYPSQATEGLGSMSIDYWFTYIGRIPSFTLTKNIPLEAFPDSIWLDTKFDGKDQRISYKISTSTNAQFLTFSSITNHTQFKPIGSEVPVKPLVDYPLALESVRIEFMKNPEWITNKLYQGTINIDNLRVSYPGYPPIVGLKEEFKIHSLSGFQVYPNPAKDIFKIDFDLNYDDKVTIALYDIFGRLVSYQILNELNLSKEVTTKINCSNLEAGMYLLQLSTSSEIVTRNIIIY